MTPATSHLIGKSAGMGLVIELCLIALFFLPRLAGSDDPKPLAEALYFAFHLPGIFLLHMMGFGMGRLVDIIPVAIAGWLQCSFLVWLTSLMSGFLSRKPAD